MTSLTAATSGGGGVSAATAGWAEALKASPFEAGAALRLAVDGIPNESDPRTEFFVQWRARTLADLEAVFSEDVPGAVAGDVAGNPVKAFREIEFSPRRLSGEAEVDAPVRREACRAGCAAARQLLQSLLDLVEAMPAPISRPMPHAGASTTGAASAAQDTASAATATTAATPALVASAPTISAAASALSFGQPVARTEDRGFAGIKPMEVPMQASDRTNAAHAPSQPASAPAAGSHPQTHPLASSVRRGIGRVLAAWDRGDRDAAAVISARLLSDLTLLADDPSFRRLFDGLAAAASDAEGEPADPMRLTPAGAAPSAQSFWCMVLATARLTAPAVAPAPAAAERPAA